MATVAEINAELGTTGMNAQAIIEDDFAQTTTVRVYCVGGVDAPGRARWVSLTVADSAATSAAAVLTALRA